jgi:hypothetical protein
VALVHLSMLLLPSEEISWSYCRQAPGGENLLLDEFENLGLHCNPQTQLVVTCEVCRRPATKECWTCKMQICEFCTLKRHWKVGQVDLKASTPQTTADKGPKMTLFRAKLFDGEAE